MKKWKKLIAVAACAAMLIPTLSVGVAADEDFVPAHSAVAPPEKKTDLVIGYSFINIGTNPWMKMCAMSIEEKLDEYKEQGIVKEYYGTSADMDGIKQQQDIRDLIAKGCDAIMYMPMNRESCAGAIKEAHQAGIVTLNFGIKGVGWEGGDICTVNPDDADSGYQNGHWLGEQMPEGGHYVFIAGQEGDESSDLRVSEARRGLAETNPTAVEEAIVYCGYDYATARTQMEDLLTAYPDIDGVLCTAGQAAMGAADVMAEHDHFLPCTGGNMNGFLKMWKQFRDEFGFSSVSTDSTPGLGGYSVEILMDYLLNGVEPEEEMVLQKTPLITNDNLDEYVREDLPDAYFPFDGLSEERLKMVFEDEMQ